MPHSAEWCEDLAVITICPYPGVSLAPYSVSLWEGSGGGNCPFQSIGTASVITWPTAATEGQLHCVAQQKLD